MSDILAGPVERQTTALQQYRRRPAAYSIPTTAFDQKFIAFLISISGVAKTDRVLELACGNGNATLAFAARCARAIGIDVIEEPLRLAQSAAIERNIVNTDFIVSEVERLSFNDGVFNGALCRFAFHHFANPTRVFAELARVVAPGGWMVIVDMVTSEDPGKAALHNSMERLCDPTHSRALAASEFERMFTEHGLRVAMRVARDARLTLDDWIRFGGAPPENIAKLRAMVAEALDQDRAGLNFTCDADQIRLVHKSVSC
jgi:ubiquinone/menaquinone biosynthesis C-methylase UbiE